jgi:iron complex outermembrane receptor protein
VKSPALFFTDFRPNLSMNSHGVPSPLRQHLLAAAISATFSMSAFVATGDAFAQTSTTPVAETGESLPEVTVTGKAPPIERATGPVKGYVAKRSATGTKTDTPLAETPQSISVVTSDQMRDLHAQTLQDALAYTSGIASGAAGLNPALADTFYLRGFQADNQFGSFYRDGMRYMANIYNGKQEPYGLERVELLKGPASILYGAAAPGGVINAVTKRPQIESLHEINLELGSFDRKQVSADFAGALDAQGEWSYRLTMLGRDSSTFVDYGQDDRVYLAPALTWRPSANTSLTLLTSYQKARQSDAGTLPIEGTLIDSPNGQIPRDRYLGEPEYSRFDTHTRTVGYVFEHAFNDKLKLNHQLRQYDATLDYQYFLLPSPQPTGATTLTRQARQFNDDTSILTSDTNLQYVLKTDAVEQTWLFGLDYSKSNFTTTRQRGIFSAPINVYAPVYGASRVLVPYRKLEDNRRQTGLYVQDQIKIDQKWIVLVGGRHDSFHNEDVFNGASTKRNDSAATGRAGLVYLADNGLAPYLSYSESFNPTSGTDFNGNTFQPDEGKQYEAGLRYQPKGTDIMLTAAVYQLTRSNVLTGDPAHPGDSITAGEVRSRGLELEAKGKVTRNLNVVASYTYNDTRIIKSNPTLVNGTPVSTVGTRFPNAPYHVASLWGNLNLGAWGVQGLTAGAGVRYVADKPGNTVLDGSYGVPEYTLVDGRLAYQQSNWLYALNVSNLTDKRYIPSTCFKGVTGCDYGEPRKVAASVSYRW